MKTHNRTIASLAIASFLWSTVASALPGQLEPLVWVSENGTAYHRAGCVRLRFGRSLDRVAAAERYAPCPVCHPEHVAEAVAVASTAAPVKPRRVVPAVLHNEMEDTTVAPGVAARPLQAALREEQPRALPARGRKRDHSTLGAIVGTVVGFGVGGVLVSALAENNGLSKEVGLLVFFGTAGLCGIGGYAIGGGFSDRVDEALEQGRARLREVPAAEPSPDPARSVVAGK